MLKQITDTTLLLIEDDDIDAMTIERSFQKQRLNNPIARAYDGLEALEMLRSGTVTNPMVIVLDLNMPRMGGIDFLKELRADTTLADTMVFVLTTSTSEDDLKQANNYNITGYFIKCDVDEKFAAIVEGVTNYWMFADEDE